MSDDETPNQNWCFECPARDPADAASLDDAVDDRVIHDEHAPSCPVNKPDDGQDKWAEAKAMITRFADMYKLLADAGIGEENAIQIVRSEIDRNREQITVYGGSGSTVKELISYSRDDVPTPMAGVARGYGHTIFGDFT